MLTALIVLATVAVCSAAAFCAWALGRVAARADAFDEHAATACALLEPDNPALPDDSPFADDVEAWLRACTPTVRPAAPDTEDPR